MKESSLMQHGIGEVVAQSHLFLILTFSKPKLNSAAVLPRGRERERKFHLTPVGPGYGHMGADAAEETVTMRRSQCELLAGEGHD